MFSEAKGEEEAIAAVLGADCRELDQARLHDLGLAIALRGCEIEVLEVRRVCALQVGALALLLQDSLQLLYLLLRVLRVRNDLGELLGHAHGDPMESQRQPSEALGSKRCDDVHLVLPSAGKLAQQTPVGLREVQALEEQQPVHCRRARVLQPKLERMLRSRRHQRATVALRLDARLLRHRVIEQHVDIVARWHQHLQGGPLDRQSFGPPLERKSCVDEGLGRTHTVQHAPNIERRHRFPVSRSPRPAAADAAAPRLHFMCLLLAMTGTPAYHVVTGRIA
mmetsp:Transcript_9753/g.28322  ORF Transcript_9753/g.28322 Transcript_9753/m.28322 type:complete len:280 (+) Transcript_9753:127-966(+)